MSKIHGSKSSPICHQVLDLSMNFNAGSAKPPIPAFCFLKTAEKKDKSTIIPEIKKEVREVDEPLDQFCQTTLRQPLPSKPLIFMTYASIQEAYSGALTENDMKSKIHVNAQNLFQEKHMESKP